MSGLFGTPSPPSLPATPAPVEPKPPAPMPDPDSAGVREAERRARADILKRGGRASTILTTPENRTTDSYDRRTLGGA